MFDRVLNNTTRILFTQTWNQPCEEVVENSFSQDVSAKLSKKLMMEKRFNFISKLQAVSFFRDSVGILSLLCKFTAIFKVAGYCSLQIK